MSPESLASGETLRVYTDGASRGNPGAAACAYVFATPRGAVFRTDGAYLGEATNNRAEYEAVKLALEDAVGVHDGPVAVHSDSQLVVNQLAGEWRVRSSNLRPLHDEVTALRDRFPEVQFRHVPRENARVERADAHCNDILDRVGGRSS